MASKTMPEGNAPSPITATTCRSSWPQQVVAALQAQHGRDAAAGVAGHEQVVVAFVRVGVAHQAPLGAHRAELVVAAGDQLVRIDLVAGVPDQPVAAEVERGVQRQAKLDHAQVRGEVGRAVARPGCTAPRASRRPAARARHATGRADRAATRSSRASLSINDSFPDVSGQRFQAARRAAPSGASAAQASSINCSARRRAFVDAQQAGKGQLAAVANPCRPACRWPRRRRARRAGRR